MRLLAMLLASVPFIVVSAPASAQAAPDPTGQGSAAPVNAAPAPAASSTGDPSSQDIVVTAQRRSESEQKVPISLQVFTGAALEAQNIRTTLDLPAITPGLNIASDNGIGAISLRGVGTGYSGPGLEGSVGIYIDDSYIASQVGAVTTLLDIGQVQVLKGPQGSLYGRNATGGALLLSTADPVQATTSGSVSAGYGNYNWADVRAILNLPVTSTLAFRFAGDYERRDGYVQNLNTGKDIANTDNYMLRAKIGWQPSPAFNAVAKIEYTRALSDDLLRQERLGGTLCAACLFAPGGGPATGFYTSRQSESVEPSKQTALLASLRMTYDFDRVKLSSVTAYRHTFSTAFADQDAQPANILEVCLTCDNRHDSAFTQEIRANTVLPGWLNFAAGASYERDRNHFGLDLGGLAFGGLDPLFFNHDQLDSWSIYGEGYASVTSHLKLTFGARYTDDRKRHSFVNNPDAVLVFGETSNSQKASFSDFTPRAVIAYDSGPVNIYASFNEGFKSGGFNSPSGSTQPAIKPEKIKAYEVGGKFRLDDGRVRINVAAFHYDWTNLQVSFIDASTGGLFTQNAASAKNDGVEASLGLVPIPGLTIDLNGLYMHSRYTSFPAAAVYLPADPVGLVAAGEDVRGFETPRAPKFSGSLRANYNFAVGGDWKADLGAVANYTSRFDFDPGAGGPLRFDRQAHYATLNLNAALSPPGKRLTFSVFANNVTEAHYAIDRNTTSLGAYELVAPPRTVGGRVTFDF